jgi:hypothetical protein
MKLRITVKTNLSFTIQTTTLRVIIQNAIKPSDILQSVMALQKESKNEHKNIIRISLKHIATSSTMKLRITVKTNLSFTVQTITLRVIMLNAIKLNIILLSAMVL